MFDHILGSDKLKTVLMMVMRNATTDSPWPVSNNPFAKYQLRFRADCSLRTNCNLDWGKSQEARDSQQVVCRSSRRYSSLDRRIAEYQSSRKFSQFENDNTL